MAGGIGVGSAWFLVFLVLKLTGVVAWSWVWVLAPLWVPPVAVVTTIAVLLMVANSKNQRDLRRLRK
jgi:Flp pilus assembly protein TadB